MTARARRPPVVVALRVGVVVLALIGFAGSVSRAIGTVDGTVLNDGPAPELSGLDRGGALFLAFLVGADAGTEAYAAIEEQVRRMLGKFNRHPVATLLHVLPAALLVVLVPLQLVPTIRARRPGWHRTSGRVIVVLAVPVGLSGLYFGLRMPFGGVVEASGIGLFGGLFFYALARGFRAIRRRRVAEHREWMIRLVAVALGPSAVRIVAPVLAVLTGQGPEAWFGLSVWLGFGSTVAVAELWIRRTRADGSRGVGTPPAPALAGKPV